MENVNPLSMVIATIIPLVTSMIIYNKAMFGNHWTQAFGISEDKVQKAGTPFVILVCLVLSSLLAFFMLNFCNGTGQEGEFDTFRHGAAHGAILSVFVIFPVIGINGLFEQGGMLNLKLRMLMFVNTAYWVITLALMGGVLDAMNHF
ncbi:MAG: DUF1761 domain-containing protein [Bacteroidia bacterium]|nr:DUF1761 domain-containing protein [Bacteroidia bacterium]